MLNVEIRFLMQGREMSVDSVLEVVMRQVRSAVREEISRTFTKHDHQLPHTSPKVGPEMPRQAVSVREAARLLSISPRTMHNYIASNSIRTVRVGRRVLVPMKSVNDVASRGISWRCSPKANP